MFNERTIRTYFFSFFFLLIRIIRTYAIFYHNFIIGIRYTYQ